MLPSTGLQGVELVVKAISERHILKPPTTTTTTTNYPPPPLLPPHPLTQTHTQTQSESRQICVLDSAECYYKLISPDKAHHAWQYHDEYNHQIWAQFDQQFPNKCMVTAGLIRIQQKEGIT